ncbi:hypothetical protein PR048_029119 [Dryococelus australis]|uniref:Uncharacterized protein n=1 Tax=Dryococelus australis TaxID=614101 RepID=A0ABQ9GD26_9NEOP|nr:hypothetical protein PR048_029119 [Dryococelus australis]
MARHPPRKDKRLLTFSVLCAGQLGGLPARQAGRRCTTSLHTTFANRTCNLRADGKLKMPGETTTEQAEIVEDATENKAPVVNGTNVETLPRNTGKQSEVFRDGASCTWNNDFVKAWETEIRMAGPGIEPGLPECESAELPLRQFAWLEKNTIARIPCVMRLLMHCQTNSNTGMKALGTWTWRVEMGCSLRAAVAERLACSPPTIVNRVQSPIGSLPDFRMWESCRMMPLVGGFSRDLPFPPRFHSGATPRSPQITLVGDRVSGLKDGLVSDDVSSIMRTLSSPICNPLTHHPENCNMQNVFKFASPKVKFTSLLVFLRIINFWNDLAMHFRLLFDILLCCSNSRRNRAKPAWKLPSRIIDLLFCCWKCQRAVAWTTEAVINVAIGCSRLYPLTSVAVRTSSMVRPNLPSKMSEHRSPIPRGPNQNQGSFPKSRTAIRIMGTSTSKEPIAQFRLLCSYLLCGRDGDIGKCRSSSSPSVTSAHTHTSSPPPSEISFCPIQCQLVPVAGAWERIIALAYSQPRIPFCTAATYCQRISRFGTSLTSFLETIATFARSDFMENHGKRKSVLPDRELHSSFRIEDQCVNHCATSYSELWVWFLRAEEDSLLARLPGWQVNYLQMVIGHPSSDNADGRRRHFEGVCGWSSRDKPLFHINYWFQMQQSSNIVVRAVLTILTQHLLHSRNLQIRCVVVMRWDEPLAVWSCRNVYKSHYSQRQDPICVQLELNLFLGQHIQCSGHRTERVKYSAIGVASKNWKEGGKGRGRKRGRNGVGIKSNCRPRLLSLDESSRRWIGSEGLPRAPCCASVSLLASHLGEPGSIPNRVTPGFLHVGIVPDDAAGRLVLSGISRFLRPFIPALLHITSITLIGSQEPAVKSLRNLFTHNNHLGSSITMNTRWTLPIITLFKTFRRTIQTRPVGPTVKCTVQAEAEASTRSATRACMQAVVEVSLEEPVARYLSPHKKPIENCSLQIMETSTGTAKSSIEPSIQAAMQACIEWCKKSSIVAYAQGRVYKLRKKRKYARNPKTQTVERTYFKATVSKLLRTQERNARVEPPAPQIGGAPTDCGTRGRLFTYLFTRYVRLYEAKFVRTSRRCRLYVVSSESIRGARELLGSARLGAAWSERS